jgi:hypothetical protein
LIIPSVFVNGKADLLPHFLLFYSRYASLIVARSSNPILPAHPKYCDYGCAFMICKLFKIFVKLLSWVPVGIADLGLLVPVHKCISGTNQNPKIRN